MDYAAEFERRRALVEEELEGCFMEDCLQGELLEAMRYSLLAGGKRIRPVLLLSFCAASGGEMERALPAACGVEMLHTYSLIHDDLPCMDDDELRRGKPTCHMVYGEANAVLAGDALQAAAFRYVLSGSVEPECMAAMAAILAEAAGERGMCGGQYLDTGINSDEMDENYLRQMYTLKTGALLMAACRMGAICGGGTPQQLSAAGEYARNLGIAFQIMDDLLDVTSTTEELGKPVGSDEENGKTTFATLLGVNACRRLIAVHTEKAKTAVRGAFEDSDILCWLADSLAERRS